MNEKKKTKSIKFKTIKRKFVKEMKKIIVIHVNT